VLIARLATATVGIPVLLLVVWLGGPAFWLLVALAAAIAASEAGSLLGVLNAGYRAIAIVGAAILVLAAASSLESVLAALTAILGSLLLWSLRDETGRAPIWPGSLAACVYGGLPLALLVIMRSWAGPAVTVFGSANGLVLERGAGWVLVALTITWAADSAAYVAGRAVGRHLFVPRLSPKKTWEGTLAGLLAGTLVALAWAQPLGWTAIAALVFGVLAAGGSIAGDLAESALKRASGAKDAGQLLPGHGGLLDRIDSLAFSASVVFLTGSLDRTMHFLHG
jgi:phosphatidate cytidylyltransferase